MNDTKENIYLDLFVCFPEYSGVFFFTLKQVSVISRDQFSRLQGLISPGLSFRDPV